METPLSTRRITRSQTQAVASRKIEDSEKELTKSRQRNMKQQQDRSALIDITNDSPIVGLAMGNYETPSSAMSKKRIISSSNRGKPESTPGSGEALLRGQVKNLLQKVEEEAELSKLSVENRPFVLLPKGLIVNNSPMGLTAPTPANTPQVLTLSAQTNQLVSPAESLIEEKLVISQKEEEVSEMDTSMMVTRSLLLDFSEKSEISYSSECSSAVTYQGTEESSQEEGKEKTNAEDDDASIWSIQVNASTKDDQENDDSEQEGLLEEEYNEDDDDDDDDGDEYYYEEEEEEVDELCEAVSKISMAGGEKKPMAKFAGKHTRFCYNSEDEIEGEEEEVGSCCKSNESPVMRLKGLPTPKGKHLRFPDE